ncbi:hypothetical protein NHQ30_000817 [Ciborinia camelliae]|nr:hypothetical protein NHQ30_000817 [Ciborinia camelliae]
MERIVSSRRVPYLYALYTTLNTAGTVLCEAPLLRLVERSFCREYYLKNDPSLIGLNGQVEERYCKVDDVQSAVAELLGWEAFLTAMIGSFQEVFDIRFVLLANLFTFIGGGPTVTFSIIHAIIADSLPHSSLASALYFIRAAGLAVDVGALAAAAKLMTLNLWLPPLVGFPIYITCLPILALIPGAQEDGYKIVNGTEIKINEEFELQSNEISTQTNLDSLAASPRSLLGNGNSRSLTKGLTARIRKIYLICHRLFAGNPISQACLIIYFLDSLATNVNGIAPQWASKNLGWTIAETNYLLSFRSFISGIVLILLPLLSRILRHRDISSSKIDLGITSCSMIFLLLGSVAFGFSWSKSVFIMALAVDSLGGGFHDALKSYCTAKVPPQEVTQLYIGIATAARVGNLIGSPLWAGMFVISMDAGRALSGLPFWASAVVWSVVGYLLWGLRTKSL